MRFSSITQKGRVTIPAEIRHKLGLGEGDKVQFTLCEQGVYLSAVKQTGLLSLYGLLPKPSKELSLEEMNRIVEKRS